MDIIAFIRDLLYSHDCVIVPGFGGFIGNYTPAQIDKTTSTFSPPVKQISFNRNLNHNDGLLVGRISGISGISYQDARNIVDEFTLSLKKRLEKGEKIQFEGIGSFINNQEGSIQFEPYRNVNYHLDSYGLEPFQYPPLEEYDVRKRVIMHTGNTLSRRPASARVLWRAAVIVPLVVAAVAISLKTDIFKTRLEKSALNPLSAGTTEYRESISENSNKESSAVTADVVDDTIKPVLSFSSSDDLQVAVSAEMTDYYLITGSFQFKENADQQADILISEGYIPEIIPAPNGFFRVSAARCNDLNAAVSMKESLSKKYPGTWVKKI